MNREQIIKDFYVLASDYPEGVRYCELAQLWYDMARDSPAGNSPGAVLAEMTRLQRDHEGQVSASKVMAKLEAIEARLDALHPTPQPST